MQSTQEGDEWPSEQASEPALILAKFEANRIRSDRDAFCQRVERNGK